MGTALRKSFGAWHLDQRDPAFSGYPTLATEMGDKLWVFWFDQEEGRIVSFWMGDDFDQENGEAGALLPGKDWSLMAVRDSIAMLTAARQLPPVAIEALGELFLAEGWSIFGGKAVA